MSGVFSWVLWAAILFAVGWLIWFKVVPYLKGKVG